MQVDDTVTIQGYHPDFNGQEARVVEINGNYVLVRLDNGSLLDLLSVETSGVSVDTCW